MSTEVKSWISEEYQSEAKITTQVKDHVRNILTFNFHDFGRFRTHNILLELSEDLHTYGNSAIIYGVGNFGFKLTHYFNPMARDGKIEGHSNDPANDSDFIIVTDAKLKDFKRSAFKAVNAIRERYINGREEYFYPWTILNKPEWNSSNFDIPPYCSVKYVNRGHEKEVKNLMELHWLQVKPDWHNELFSKYSPWYSTRVGCPIIPISEVSGNLNAGIWQPFYQEIDPEKPHEVKISVPEVFGNNSRDILQSTRIVLAIVQATFAADKLAILSKETKKCLAKGIKKSAKMLTEIQRSNAVSRLRTTIHRASSLQKRIKYEYDGRFSLPNPFVDLQPVDLVVRTLDEIGWGKNVLGKTVKEFLS